MLYTIYRPSLHDPGERVEQLKFDGPVHEQDGGHEDDTEIDWFDGH